MPGSLAKTLSSYKKRYGEGFYQRAMEAIRCRDSQAWLACCTMVGAAAESILLAVAINKSGNEDAVLATYSRASGRSAILKEIVGKSSEYIRNNLNTFSEIISNWRNEAAHGKETVLDTANADELLRQLLLMCQWVDKYWETLTTK
jgi:hypothetical protein